MQITCKAQTPGNNIPVVSRPRSRFNFWFTGLSNQTWHTVHLT